MEHVIASYLRRVWDRNDWLYEGQHWFRLGYTCKSHVITVCQDISDTLDNGYYVSIADCTLDAGLTSQKPVCVCVWLYIVLCILM